MQLKHLILITLFAFSFMSTQQKAHAQQDCMIGEVKMFAGNFAPRAWAFAQGQLLPINQNTALFSILGTTYGGDGRTTFGLPDLRGRAPIGVGQGPGLPDVVLGQQKGTTDITATGGSHQHLVSAVKMKDGQNNNSNDPNPKTRLLMVDAAPAEPDVQIVSSATGGGVRSSDNHQPSMGMNYIICLQGTFPSRN